MSEHGFTVGQDVRCVKKYGHRLTEGNIYQIVSVSNDGDYYRVRCDDGVFDGFHEEYFKPAIPEVGSRWIAKNAEDEARVVAMADAKNVVSELTDGTCRYLWGVQEFFGRFKPEPKTTVLYLNLYEALAHKTLEGAKSNIVQGYLGTIKHETDSNGETTVTQVDLDSE